MKYQSSSTHCSKVIIKVNVFKNGSNSKVKVTGLKIMVPTEGFITGIFIWNIKVLALTVQKLSARLKFQRRGQNDRITEWQTGQKEYAPDLPSRVHKKSMYYFRCFYWAVQKMRKLTGKRDVGSLEENLDQTENNVDRSDAFYVTIVGGVYWWLTFVQSTDNKSCTAGNFKINYVHLVTKHLSTGFYGKMHFTKSSN